MLRALVLLISVSPLGAQTAARMLALATSLPWEQPPSAACKLHTPIQMDTYATVEFTHHCSETREGIVRESFFYVFGEPASAARLRVDVHLVDESLDLLPDLRRRLTARFGPPNHEPEMMEIGFRHLRYGQPVAGDHWNGGGLHYFLHANQTNPSPTGMRHGVQLIVLTDRLFAERERDAFIERAGEDDPVRTRLKARLGELFTRGDLAALLAESDRAGRPRRALYLLAADEVVNHLAQTTTDPATLRRQLTRYNAKVGGQTHQGGLDYAHDLLWRVWREFPETEGGELAFLLLQRRGWDTSTGEGCPPNPDLFRTVIERGEAFLAQHPRTDFRLEVTYTLAVANESWWSIAHAKSDDQIVADIPYPRKAANAREGEAARQRAIAYYRDVVRLGPDSPQAADALRRLPRLEIGLDTGQRRFFCFYC